MKTCKTNAKTQPEMGRNLQRRLKEAAEITKQAGKRIYNIFELKNRKYTGELGVAVTMQTCIRLLLVSNLDRGSDCSMSFLVCSVSPSKFHRSTHIRAGMVILNPFHFINHPVILGHMV
jgi:hypothetical protein